MVLQTNLKFSDINERKEAEVRLQSLADNLPGVVFQYLIYTDGTDNLKYVTREQRRCGDFLQRKYYRTCS
jgi:hypothetical protein